MRKKLLSVLLALSMVLALTPTAVWAAGTEAAPEVQSIVPRGDGVEDDAPNAKYGEAYEKAGLSLSEQPDEGGAYTLTIDKESLEAIVEKGRDDPTFKILENNNNPNQLWFGMEYKRPSTAEIASKAVVKFDSAGDSAEVEFNNAAKDGFYNYIKVYAADPDGTNGEIGPVKSETAVIEWLDSNGQVLTVTKAVLNVVVKEPPVTLTIGNTDLTGPFFPDDTVVTQPSNLGEFTVTANGNDVTVTGSVNEIENWTQFSSITAEQSGHYVPLKLTPSEEGCAVTVQSSKTIPFPNWPKDGDTLIMRLDDLEDDYTFTIEISKDGREGTTYTVDCSALMSSTTPPEPQTFTVTFDSKGGSGVNSQTIAKDSKVRKPTDPTKTGYTFGGWYKNEACTEPWNFNTDTVTENLTLYAKWTRESTVTGYTITFDGNGGSVTPAAANTKTDGKLESLPTPTRDRYKFDGWFTEASGGDKVTTATVFTRNATIYAHWTKADETKDEFTVTFNSQGGSEVEKQTVKSGEKAKKPGDPKRDGYEFGGWYKEKDCKNEWDFDTKITADTELFAKWTEIKDPDGPGEEEKDEYSISVQSGIRHGRIYVTHQHARPGEWVTITVSPDTDYTLDWIRVERSNGYRLYLDQDGRKYSFVMPYSDVTIDAGFDLRSVYTSYTYYQPVETASSPAASTPVFPQSTWRPVAIMRDVPTNSWAYPSAQWAYQNGYLDTAADGSFRLNAPVSHRQMWKIMAQWLNAPAMDDRELTNWAMQNGAARGNHAAGSMTRQDVVTYLYQCCFLMGGDVSASGNLSQYSDSRLLTSAASRNAWTWAVSKGIISGTSDGYLNPSGTVNRGEFAAILMRLCQNVTK